jgi:hypothetical protein
VKLLDIRSVVHSEEAQPFDRLIETGADEITDLLVVGGVIDSHGEVVDLTQKEEAVLAGTAGDGGLRIRQLLQTKII